MEALPARIEGSKEQVQGGCFGLSLPALLVLQITQPKGDLRDDTLLLLPPVEPFLGFFGFSCFLSLLLPLGRIGVGPLRPLLLI